MNLFACAIGGALCKRFLKKVALILRTTKQNYILDTYFLLISDPTRNNTTMDTTGSPSGSYRVGKLSNFAC